MTIGHDERSSESDRPPWWADVLLRCVLPPADAETVSGDLLEEYRETVRPSRGGWPADLWFAGQVAGFVWRATWIWGVLFASLMVGRNALDWFVPPTDFVTRSTVTTYAAISVFVAVGFASAYRTGSLRASILTGLGTGAIAYVLTLSGNLLLLAIWRDEATMRAIERSGGVGEALWLPLLVLVPGMLLASAGGLLGKGLRVTRSG